MPKIMMVFPLMLNHPVLYHQIIEFFFFYLSNFWQALFSLLNMLLNSECLWCSVLALYIWTGTGRHRHMAVLQILCLARSVVGHSCKAGVPSPCGFLISHWVSHKLWFQDLWGKERLFVLGLHGPQGQKTSSPLTASCYSNTNNTLSVAFIMGGRPVSLDSSGGSPIPWKLVACFPSAAVGLGCGLSLLATCCFASGKMFEVLCLRLCFLSALRTLRSSQMFPLSHSLRKKKKKSFLQIRTWATEVLGERIRLQSKREEKKNVSHWMSGCPSQGRKKAVSFASKIWSERNKCHPSCAPGHTKYPALLLCCSPPAFSATAAKFVLSCRHNTSNSGRNQVLWWIQ